MPEQSLARYDRVRRDRLPGETGVRLARLFLFAATLLLTALLVHQMWLVLSVGGLTGVEKAMLGLFVVNIAWVGFGAISPLMGFMLGPEQAPPPDAPPTARTALLMPTYNEDPARIVGAACAMMRAIDADGGGSAFDLFILSDTNRADVWLAEQAMVDAARADPDIGPRLYYRHRGPQPAAQGRQHRRLGRALGRRLSVHAGARRRQPDGGRHHHRARPPHGGRRRRSASCRPRRI